jgi:subtilase family serine protease
MLRRFVVMSGVTAIGAVVALVPVTNSGAAPASPAFYSKRVCAISFSSTRAGCFSWVETDAAGRVMIRALPGPYGPAKLHKAYHLPTASPTNQTIAIVDAFSNPNVLSDLDFYNSTFGLPPFPRCTGGITTGCIAVLNQFGKEKPLPPGNVGWGLEIALDVQVAHAICQNCRINLYEANSNSFANLETAVNTAAAQDANAISNSYGSFGYDCTEPGYDHPNIAVTVSSGDSGFGIACPAVERTVVSVGGTTLNLNGDGSYNSESVWRGTGSGCSSVSLAQAWQTTASNWAAVGCGTHRGMTDVSAVADPKTGVATYDTYGFGGWLRVGGTSLSAPLIAGVYALAANASTYAYPAQSVYLAPRSLHDVTTGSNGSCPTHPLQCRGGAGYDLPTGIGSPKGLGGF